MKKILYLAIVALMTLNLADLKAGEDRLESRRRPTWTLPPQEIHLPRWQNSCSKLSTIQVCR